MQNTHIKTPATPQRPGSSATTGPKSVPIPLSADLLKHVSGGTKAPTKGW